MYCSTTDQQCPEGYLVFQDTCYKLYTETKTRTDAAEDCEAKGAHLVDIKSLEENTFVEWLIFKYGVEDTWFGLVKPDESNLVWSDGTPVSSKGWHDIRIGSSNHPCFYLDYISDDQYRWNDKSCNREYAFVCEGEKGN